MSNNLVFLAVAYAVVWVIIAAYVFFVGRRQAVVGKQIDTLKVEVEELKQKGERA